MTKRLLAVLATAVVGGSLMIVAPTAAVAADVPGQPVVTAVFGGPSIGSITVDWTAPDPADGITKYQVRYTESTTDNWSDPINTGVITEKTVTGLDPTQYYVFQVKAFNSTGGGEWSAESIPGQPTQGVGAPQYLSTVPGQGLVDFRWVAPDSGAAGYQVQYRTDVFGSAWEPAAPLSTKDTTYRVTDLTPGVNYFFRVRSVNSVTDVSEWAGTTTAVGPLSGPSAPSNVRAVAGNASATVSWSAPYPTPNRYEVQYRVANSGSTYGPATPINANTTSTVVTGLTNGTPYYFRVRAVTGSTSSDWIETTSPVTPVGQVTPAAPTSVTAVPGDTALTISWVEPAGQAVTNYEIQYSLNNSSWLPNNPISNGKVDTHYVLTGLTNGTPYYVRVRAVNGSLSSNWTQISGYVIPLAVPGPPLQVTGVPANNQVTLNWVAPTAFGAMSPVTGYRIQYSPNGGATWVSAPDQYTTATTSIITGLTNGTGYIFRVRATSYSGDGAWSANSNVITPPGGPSAPSNVTAVAGSAQATVTWSPGTSAGSPIIGYRVTSSPGGNSCTTSAVPPSTPATSCVVNGLTNGQAYTFTVVSVTGTGTSAASAASAPVTPKQSAAIRITDSGRNGAKVQATGTTVGITSGTALTALVKSKAGGKFVPTGQVTVQDDGTFTWTTTTKKKVWVKFTGAGVTSNTVIIGK